MGCCTAHRAGGAPANSQTGVGFAPITIHDPVSGDMPGYVFYPSAQASGVTWIGPCALHATRGASPLPGAKSLVVISHGHGGSDLGHHDLAAYLAGHGFVVATLQHPRDNFLDDSGDGHPEVMIGRPIQVKAAIGMLLADPNWEPLIDPSRIGVAGVSNGGYTSLLLVGAVPRFTRLMDYCKAHPDDPGICGGVKHLVAQLAKKGTDAKAVPDRDAGTIPPLEQPRRSAYQGRFRDGAAEPGFRQGRRGFDRPPGVPLLRAKRRSAATRLQRPAHRAFDQDAGRGQDDPQAGHYVFPSPCSPQLAKDAPDICIDPPGMDRAAVHRQVDADALAFFRETPGNATQ